MTARHSNKRIVKNLVGFTFLNQKIHVLISISHRLAELRNDASEILVKDEEIKVLQKLKAVTVKMQRTHVKQVLAEQRCAQLEVWTHVLFIDLVSVCSATT